MSFNEWVAASPWWGKVLIVMGSLWIGEAIACFAVAKWLLLRSRYKPTK